MNVVVKKISSKKWVASAKGQAGEGCGPLTAVHALLEKLRAEVSHRDATPRG